MAPKLLTTCSHRANIPGQCTWAWALGQHPCFQPRPYHHSNIGFSTKWMSSLHSNSWPFSISSLSDQPVSASTLQSDMYFPSSGHLGSASGHSQWCSNRMDTHDSCRLVSFCRSGCSCQGTPVSQAQVRQSFQGFIRITAASHVLFILCYTATAMSIEIMAVCMHMFGSVCCSGGCCEVLC
jgi:hypothetical protein